MIGMKETKISKLIAMVLVFMMMFSNFGYTLAAIATSDGFEVITNGFFKKEEIEFEAFFEEDSRESEEKISDVNQRVKLKVKLTPKVEGYLKEAKIKAVSEDGGNPNFKITNVEAFSTEIKAEENEQKLVNVGQKEELDKNSAEENEVELNSEQEKIENVAEETTTTNESVVENVVKEDAMEDKLVENATANNIENQNNEKEEDVANSVTSENAVEQTTTTNESVVENVVEEKATEDKLVENATANNIDNQNNEIEEDVANNVTSENVLKDTTTTNESVVENVVKENTTEDNVENEVSENTQEVTIPASLEKEEVLVDEEKVIEEKMEEAEEEEINFISDVKVVSENEISLSNVINETVYVIDLEYMQGEELNIADLYREISLQLTGTFINSDLEEIQIAKEEKIRIGWKYSKDVELRSEYTKFSPFKIGDKVGTIVENKIVVKREITEGKYLPIKSTKIEVQIPNFEGKVPTEVNVLASKLLATKGQDIGEVTFGEENWNYDRENGKIQIIVTNEESGKAQNANGEDEYTIIYRYEDYTEDITSNLNRNVVLEVEEYSAKENNILRKEIKEEQKIDANVGELVTYSINTTEDRIEKSKIYANYNSEQPLYETEYTSNVTVNILTSDMLEKLKIDCSKEIYKDIDGNEFKAEGITYKKIKFNYNEINTILEKGGNIEIYSKNGELLYTLNNDLVNSEQDCEINLNYVEGIEVYVNNITVNGTINFEVTKVIKKCNYQKSALKNFAEIESRIKAEVKYSNLDQTLELGEVKTTKGLKESYTRANVYINKEKLNTIQENDNVEIKVELNNDKEDSDLYINPSFEFVFPKYVKEVHVESINLLYENGLRVSDFETYVEEDIVKMRVELTGTQTTFSESALTNGTNILINVKIKVDEYTPSKEDQIKLYYCNEGVSNYESQTKWTIKKLIPNGILKTTNGFDVALFDYQAPNGLVAINGIRNYDGNLSEIKSVRQGITTKEIARNSESKIATMDLLVLNNTGNECSDLVMIGRIPFAGNKDVINGKDLGTTTTGVMKDLIKENIENLNMATIYYSSNPNATKSLEDGANGWRLGEYAGSLNEIRSYMIVVKGNVAPGAVLKYSYDFEIPENLQYEVNMAGSFGAYYNNNTNVAIVYESTKADLVAVKTETGPKVEATLDVDIGNGTEVGEKRFLTYTVKVENTGSVGAENVSVTIPAPKFARICEEIDSLGYKIHVGTLDAEKIFTIEKLEPEEIKTFEYKLLTKEIPTVKEYYELEGKSVYEDDKGQYLLNPETKEKEYVTLPEIFVESKAIVKVENLAIEKESNTIKNKLVDSNFDIKLETVINNEFKVGENIEYRFLVNNISGKDLENGILQFEIPKELEYISLEKFFNEHKDQNDENIIFEEDSNLLKVETSKIYKDEAITFNVRVKIVEASKETIAYLECLADKGIKEKSEPVKLEFFGGNLEISQTTNVEGNTVLEQQEVEFAVSIKNIGTAEIENLKFESQISENLENVKVEYTGSLSGKIYPKERKIDYTFYSIPKDGEILLKIKGKATTLDGQNRKVITNEVFVSSEYLEKQKTDLISLTIINNPDKVIKEPEEEEKDVIPNGDTVFGEGETSEKQNSGDVTQNPSDNLPQTNNPQTTTNNNVTNEQVPKHVISGKVWFDENKNGARDEKELKLSAVKVQLLKDGNMIKATTTDGNGQYHFSELVNGEYSVMFMYDAEKYVATNYQKKDIAEENNSNAYETEEGKAVTNKLVLSNINLNNIDLGLQDRDIFDLSINKYVVSTVVKDGSEEFKQEYNDEKLAKIEIHSKKISKSTVDVEYKFIVKNEGNISGNATQIVDYLPEGMEFDESRNEGWYLGNDGFLYNETLKETVIKQGETKELKLILTKKMTAENTGVVSNKVAILSTENKNATKEDNSNNASTQELIITIKTGEMQDEVLTIITLMLVILIVNTVILKRPLFIKNKVYKNSGKHKNNKTKKFYK